MVAQKYDYRVIKDVVNKNFTFADLSKRFQGVDDSTGNIFCPFHENSETPAAKMYWDDERNIWVLYCFGECHRHYTAYDYVDLVLCRKYQKYQSPYHFLKINMPNNKLGLQLELSQKNVNEYMESNADDKRTYIDNTYSETGNLADFIEALYTA